MGRFSIIRAGLYLHLFSWGQQVQAYQRIVTLMKKTEGNLFCDEVVGW